MGLNLSNRQISHELDLNKDDAQRRVSQLRSGIVKKTIITLSGEVEFDEVYLIVGHKGYPGAVKRARRRRLKGARGRGTLASEKPPVFGMIQRTGEVVIHLCENVQQKTIQPLIESTVALGSLIYTDEYSIYH